MHLHFAPQGLSSACDRDDLVQQALLKAAEAGALGSPRCIADFVRFAHLEAERARSRERRAIAALRILSARGDACEARPASDHYRAALHAIRATLDPRKLIVLEHLAAGTPVRTTARQLAISPTRVMQLRASITTQCKALASRMEHRLRVDAADAVEASSGTRR